MILANGKLRLIVFTAIAAMTLPLVAAACGDDDEENGGPVNGDGAATSFDIAMHETGGNFFEIDAEKNPTLRVPAGEEITVNLTNDGAAIHNMRFGGEDKEYNNDDDAVSDPGTVSGGQTATLTFVAPSQAGTYVYQCDFHPTDMLGEIEVE